MACGDYGRTTAQRLVNGTITDDCAGCGCDSWHVDLCSLDMTEYGSPYVTIRYEHDGDSFIFHVPVSLDVQTPHAGATVTASNVSYTLSPGYPVELDAVIDWTFTNSDEEGESWHIEGHVVGACPE